MFPSPAIVTQPRQRFSLRTGGLIPRHVRSHQFHIAAQSGHDGHLPALTAPALGLGRQIPHVGHDQRRAPIPLPLAIVQTGRQQPAFGHMGRSDPADQRNQRHADRVILQPQAQGVLLVTDKAPALTGLERATAQRGASRRVLAGAFFEAHTGGRQIRGVDQSDRTFPPGIRLHQRLEQMPVDPAKPGHPQSRPKLVQHPHVRHPALTAPTREGSPPSLLRQHFDQQVQGVNRREQAQQVNAKELGGGMRAVPAPGGTVRPALFDEIVGDQRIEKFKQSHRAGGRKIGIHASLSACPPLEIQLVSDKAHPSDFGRTNLLARRL